MILALSLACHLLAAVVWVGGLFFVCAALTRSGTCSGTPGHLLLWKQVLRPLWIWVWISMTVLLGSGFLMAFAVFGVSTLRLYVRVMMMLGLMMAAAQLWLHFVPWRRFREAVEAGDWSAAGRGLVNLRRTAGMCLAMGLIAIVVGGGGRYLPLG